MEHYDFGKKNAQTVAQSRIAAEETFINTNYKSLSFEDQCRYALELSPFLHYSVAPNDTRRAKLLKALRPELLRRAQNEDPFALYVLGSMNFSVPATDVEQRFLERAMNAGYVPAAMDLLNRVYYGKKREAPEAVRILEWLDEHDPNDKTDGNEKAPISIDDLLTGLRDPEHTFNETVEILVLEYFYDKGYRHLGDKLGTMLLQKNYYERDIEKIKRIYIDLMLSYRYDRKLLLALAGVPHNETSEDLYEAERVCRLLIKNGRDSNYWRLVLIALLSGNRKKLEVICDEVCIPLNGFYVVHISKAYHMLLHT